MEKLDLKHFKMVQPENSSKESDPDLIFIKNADYNPNYALFERPKVDCQHGYESRIPTISDISKDLGSNHTFKLCNEGKCAVLDIWTSVYSNCK